MEHPKDFAKGLSIGIIMDGNGRWAKSRGLPRTAGHKAGAEQAAPGGPSAVAVHNNSDMAGKAAPVHLPRRMGRFLRKQSH